jgi:thiol:disulfide interchange protein
MASACFRLMTALVALFLAQVAMADAIPKGPHVHIDLVAESATPAPGGEVTLALVETPDPGWHAYWQNPGDAGFPADAAWTLPQGVSAGALRYPVPHRLTIAGLMNYVYEAPFAPLVTVKVPAGLAAGTKLSIALRLKYLVCTNAVCVPEDAALTVSLTVGDGAIDPAARARFDGWRQKLPKPLGAQANYQVAGERVRIGIPFPAAAKADGAYFYPATDGAIDYAAPQTVTRDGDRIVVETKAKAPAGAIDGVLAAGGMGFEVHAVAGTVAPAKGAGGADSGWAAMLAAFGGAVLGGLLLNIMPCVFPILSLKALSLAKANDADGRPRAEALAYALGVILVCLGLGGVLLTLRAGGASLGWGFQLQDPRMILLLLLLVTGIALNLAGLFEINTPRFINGSAAKGTGGAFVTGALAAFIATPCSGPFMGAALGAALVLPVPAALALFAGLGLGIALPFLALGFIPALRRRLPRPGGWMVTLRRVLAVPMVLTGAALLWVLWRQAGTSGLVLGLLAIVVAGLALWSVGRRQRRGAGFAWAFALPALAAVAAAGLFLHPVAASAELDFGEPFSEARLAELQKQGRPVFAYFTADWCLTCKVNEKAVIETAAVEAALAKGKVAVLVGDWTNGDAALGRFIERHNRAGVPLYLWYKPGAAEPEVLPQILTQAMIEERASAN